MATARSPGAETFTAQGNHSASNGVVNRDQQLLEEVLRRLFEAVGRTYNAEIVTSPEWFYGSSWTKNQEHDFHDWLTRTLMKKRRMRKQRASYEASMFLLFSGCRNRTDEDVADQNHL